MSGELDELVDEMMALLVLSEGRLEDVGDHFRELASRAAREGWDAKAALVRVGTGVDPEEWRLYIDGVWAELVG